MRDLQKDLEIAYRLPEKVGLVYTGKDVVVAGIDAQSMEERGLVMDWFDAAREGWPEAIKRALAAESRVRELERILDNVLTTCAESGLATNYTFKECQALLRDISNTWKQAIKNLDKLEEITANE